MSAIKRIGVIDGNVGTSAVHDRKKESRTRSRWGAFVAPRRFSGNEGMTRSSRANRRPLPPSARSRDDPLDADRRIPQINYNRRRSIYLLFSAFFPSLELWHAVRRSAKRASLFSPSFRNSVPKERPPRDGSDPRILETHATFHFISHNCCFKV